MIILALLVGLACGWLLANQHRLDDAHDELPFQRHPSDPVWSPRSNLRVIDGCDFYDWEGEAVEPWEHDGGSAA